MKNDKLKEAVNTLLMSEDTFQIVSTLGNSVDVKGNGSSTYHIPVNKKKLKQLLVNFFLEELKTTND